MAKSTPAAPDYKGAAEQTAQSSKDVTNMQTWANRPNQNTPFGQTSWAPTSATDPSTGQKMTQWTQNTTLNPKSQAALDSQLAVTQGRSDIGAGMLNRVSQEYGPTMDWSKFGAQGGNVQGGNYYNKQAGDALYNQFSSRNEPVFQRQQAAMETQLRNQGLNPGDQAYDSALHDMRQSQNDARTNAGYQATQMAGAEGGRMQSQDIAASSQNTQNRQQQIAEEMQKRGFSLNEINGLLNGQQVGMPSMPNFTNASKSNATDYTGAAQDQYKAGLDASNAQNAMWGNLVGAGAKVGAAYLGG